MIVLSFFRQTEPLVDAPPSATHGFLGLLIVLSDAELLVIPAWPVAAPQSFITCFMATCWVVLYRRQRFITARTCSTSKPVIRGTATLMPILVPMLSSGLDEGVEVTKEAVGMVEEFRKRVTVEDTGFWCARHYWCCIAESLRRWSPVWNVEPLALGLHIRIFPMSHCQAERSRKYEEVKNGCCHVPRLIISIDWIIYWREKWVPICNSCGRVITEKSCAWVICLLEHLKHNVLKTCLPPRRLDSPHIECCKGCPIVTNRYRWRIHPWESRTHRGWFKIVRYGNRDEKAESGVMSVHMHLN